MSSARKLFSLCWEAPQTALGTALTAALAVSNGVRDLQLRDGRVIVRTGGVGISLGHFVFYTTEGSRYFAADDLMLRHELGHAVQSRWLGPLYLPLVGVPSSARAVFAVVYRELTGRRWAGYFDGWPEASADRLGGISVAERRSRLQ